MTEWTTRDGGVASREMSDGPPVCCVQGGIGLPADEALRAETFVAGQTCTVVAPCLNVTFTIATVASTMATTTTTATTTTATTH